MLLAALRESPYPFLLFALMVGFCLGGAVEKWRARNEARLKASEEKLTAGLEAYHQRRAEEACPPDCDHSDHAKHMET